MEIRAKEPNFPRADRSRAAFAKSARRNPISGSGRGSGSGGDRLTAEGRARAFGANEAIYEREYVKRGGRGFSRKAAPSGAGRADGVGADLPRPPSRGGGRKPPSVPCLRCEADATCSLNHLSGIVGKPDVAISQVSKGRRHSIARRSSGKAAVGLRCGVVPWSSRPPAVARRVAPSWSVQALLKRWSSGSGLGVQVRRRRGSGTAGSPGASRRARTGTSSPPPRSPASHRCVS